MNIDGNIRDIPLSRQRKVLEFAANCGVNIPAGKDFVDIWTQIPISDAKDHAEDIGVPATEKRERARIFFSSGGSTGSPKFTMLDFSEVLINSRIHGKGYRAAGIGPDDTVATWGIPGMMSSDFTVYLALAETGCCILPIGNSADPASVIGVIRDFGATALLVKPSNLNPIISVLEEKREAIRSIRLVVTGGEPLLATDRARYGKFLGADTSFRSVFQTSDTGTIGYQCRYSEPNEYHVHEDLQFIEIVNTGDDHVGELITTNLERKLRPVIRQRTGDLARTVEGRCNCGSSDVRIQLHGRYGRFVKFGGEKFDLNWIVEIKEHIGVRSDDFQMILERDEQGRDKFVLASNLVCNDEDLKRHAIELFSQLSEKISVQLARGVVGVLGFSGIRKDELRHSGTGKIQYFADNRI